MRLKRYLEEMSANIDTGEEGKKFENMLVKALQMIGLKFETNHYAGKMWDIKPIGIGWPKIMTNQLVNIKTANALWMFGNSDLVKILPWETLPNDFNPDKLAAKVKRLLNKEGLKDIVYVKPKNKSIEQKIMDAVDENDIDKLKTILIKDNFYIEKLGKNYKVRVLHNDERVTSVAVDKGGRVFMRTEKPRNIGAGAGTTLVTFRTPTPKLGKKLQPLIKL